MAKTQVPPSPSRMGKAKIVSQGSFGRHGKESDAPPEPGASPQWADLKTINGGPCLREAIKTCR